jgi:hypothetical protein
MLRASWFPGADPAARTQLLDDGAHGSFLSALMWVINDHVPERVSGQILRCMAITSSSRSSQNFTWRNPNLR